MSLVMKIAIPVLIIIAIVAILLPTLLHKAGMHPDYDGEATKAPGLKALVITTSHGTLDKPNGKTGKKTGVFASEMTHPYYTFLDAGMQVDLASIKGGEVPIDPQSFMRPIRSPLDDRYLNDSVFQAKVKNSLKIDDIDFTQYDIISIAGGWGAAYDLAQSTVLAEKISQAYYGNTNAIIGGVCHGVLGLVGAKANDGSLLITGREMTGVTDKQIKELGIDVTPLHPETELRKAGAVFVSNTKFRDIFATDVAVDQEQRFVTGQNQNSALEMAHKMIQLAVAK